MSALRDAIGEDPDYASMVVGTFVGVAGLLFLAEPVVDPVAVGGARIRLIVLSVFVLTAGFALGAGVYLRRGDRLIGIAHAIGAGGWGLVAGATALGSGATLFLGFAVLIGGAVFLVVEVRRDA
jgi:hypothetical protein